MNTYPPTSPKALNHNWPSIGLAIFLVSSNAAQVVRGLGLPNNLSHLVLLSGLALLWLNRFIGPPKISPRETPKKYFPVLFLISCSALMSASYDFDLSNQNQVLIKTGGLILTLWTLYSCANSFSLVALRSAMSIYAVAELGSLLLLPQADWNPNAFAARAITASVLGFYVMPKNYLKYSVLLLGIYLTIVSQSRTAVIATVFGFSFTRYARLFEKHAQILTVALLVSCLSLSLFSQDISVSGRRFLKDSIGNQDLFSQFFLSDKTADKIDNDMFDRGEQWNAAIKAIKKHPFLGVGFGNEFSILSNSTHSTYLAVTVKYGLMGLILWVIFYLQIVKDIFASRNAVQKDLNKIANFFFGYLLIAGVFESSGFVSINTPTNLILLLLAFWLSTNYHQTVNTNI